MRAGYLQFGPVFGQKEANFEKVDNLLSSAKADLVVLPELFATGYLFESRDDLRRLAEDEAGPTFTFMKDLSRKMGTAIVAGIAERDGGDCYNSCFLFSDGEIEARYRKVHLFDREKEIFTPGTSSFPVCDLNGVKLGLMVCFDWIFPEVARLLALNGAQVICHPSNLVLPYCPRAMITRCIENSVFAITVNRIGTEARAGIELTFIGMSQVIGPRGEVLIRADSKEENLRIIDINPSLADNKMVTQRNHLLDDRKPELYGDLCRPRPEPEDPGAKDPSWQGPSSQE
jgi:predicted amidohydrolase